MSKIELKPCPFCGGEAGIYANEGVVVICKKCGAMSKRFTDVYLKGGLTCNAVDSAVESWNRRTVDE